MPNSIINLHSKISFYSKSEKDELSAYFAELEKSAVTSNDSNIAVWQTARSLGAALYGRIRCTYANISIPTQDGVQTRLFSLQRGTFPELVIEDCGSAELDPKRTTPVLGAPAPCDVRDLTNADKPHVGKLAEDVWHYVQAACGGMPTTPYVLYYPKRFTWTFTPDKCATIPGEKKNWLPIALPVVLSLFTR